MIAGYRTTPTPPMWRCDLHRIWTSTDCPACDAELVALTTDSVARRGGLGNERAAIPTAVQEGVGTPLPAPSTPTACWDDCCRTPESQR